MANSSYSLHTGDADARRLELLGHFYDPASAAFLEAAGVGQGDSVADLGCGHGGVTERIAGRSTPSTPHRANCASPEPRWRTAAMSRS